MWLKIYPTLCGSGLYKIFLRFQKVIILSFSVFLFGYLVMVVLQHDNLQQTLLQLSLYSAQRWMFLLVAVLLVGVNWLFEAQKWHIAIGRERGQSFWQSLRVVLWAVAVGTLTPNRVGEIPARALSLPANEQNNGWTAAILCSATQAGTTLLAGIIAIPIAYNYFLVFQQVTNIIFWSLALALLALATMLVVFRVKTFKKYIHAKPLSTWLMLFLYSMGRYVVFVVQYIILLNTFGVHASWLHLSTAIALIYFIGSFLPSFALLELGVRNSLAVFFITIWHPNPVSIVAATSLLWCINVLLPAVIGIFWKARLTIQNK